MKDSKFHTFEASKDRSQKISKELQDTVAANEHIQNVFFTAKGGHCFHAHKDKSGNLYGRIDKKEFKNVDNGKEIKIEKPIEETKIVEVWDREQILSAETTYKSSIISLSDLSDEDRGALIDMAKDELRKKKK